MLNRNFLVGCGISGGGATEPHRYWRLRSTQALNPNDPYYESVNIRELEFRAVATGTAALTADDQTSAWGARATPITDVDAWNYPCFSSPTISGNTVPAYQPYGAFDNYDGTLNAYSWIPTPGDNGDYTDIYIGYDFETPVVVREVLVVLRNAYEGMRGIAFEYSDDKVEWHVSKEFRDLMAIGSPWPNRYGVFTLF